VKSEPPESQIYRFESFVLNGISGLQDESGVSIKLQPQPLKLLSLLVSRSGDIVTREEIQKHLWNDETFVDFEHSVNFCMRQIRAALGDDAKAPRFIETVPRKGYRFVAYVEVAVPSALDGNPVKTSEAPRRAPHLSRVGSAAVIVVLFALVGYFIWRSQTNSNAETQTQRALIAVLPFQQIGDEANLAYLSDGLTEEVIAQLGRIRPDRLGVIARNSTASFKAEPPDIRSIVDKLGVQYVLLGSVRRSDGRTRIAVRLVQASDESQIWAQTYEKTDGDVLNLQAAVAEDVAGRLTQTILREPVNRVSIKPEAEDAYLNGRYLWNKGTWQDLERSLSYFERATAADPQFANAYAAQADVYQQLASSRRLRPRDAFPKAKRAAERAIALDPTLDEAHVALGTTLFRFDWDWASAENSFRKALEINPSSATVRHDYAWFLISMDRSEKGVMQMKMARTLDPLSMRVNTDIGWAYLQAGRTDEAIEFLQGILELEPDIAAVEHCLEAAFTYKQMYEQAAELATKALVRRGIKPEDLPGYQAGNAKASIDTIWRWKLQNLERDDANAFSIASYYALLGETDEALQWLDRAFIERDAALVSVHVDVAFRTLRSDPRFEDFVKRIGLPWRSQASSTARR